MVKVSKAFKKVSWWPTTSSRCTQAPAGSREQSPRPAWHFCSFWPSWAPFLIAWCDDPAVLRWQQLPQLVETKLLSFIYLFILFRFFTGRTCCVCPFSFCWCYTESELGCGWPSRCFFSLSRCCVASDSSAPVGGALTSFPWILYRIRLCDCESVDRRTLNSSAATTSTSTSRTWPDSNGIRSPSAALPKTMVT